MLVLFRIVKKRLLMRLFKELCSTIKELLKELMYICIFIILLYILFKKHLLECILYILINLIYIFYWMLCFVTWVIVWRIYNTNIIVKTPTQNDGSSLFSLVLFLDPPLANPSPSARPIAIPRPVFVYDANPPLLNIVVLANGF